MSTFTDFRDSFYRGIGIDTSKSTGQNIAEAVLGIGRTAGEVLSSPPSGASAPESAEPEMRSPARVVEATDAIQGISYMPIVIGFVVLYFLMSGRR